MDRKIAQILIDAFKRGNKVLFCGNGGSSAQACHFAAELMGKYLHVRKPLRALSLSCCPVLLSAWSNDVDFCDVFTRQIEAWGEMGDVLVALSTSGRSINVLEAITQAHKQGLVVVDFPRRGKNSGQVQNYQLKLMHDICEIVEKAFL